MPLAYPAVQCREVGDPIPRWARFADQKSQTGLFIRTVGITRATMRGGLANIVYNMRRFLFMERISATAQQSSEWTFRSAQNADRMSPRQPSIKMPKAQNLEKGASVNGSSIPPSDDCLRFHVGHLRIAKNFAKPDIGGVRTSLYFHLASARSAAINGSDKRKASRIIEEQVRSKGKVLRGLVRRRHHEAMLMLEGRY